MAKRNVLHKNLLEDFQSWLVADGWEIEKPKGIYEVLRARKAGIQQPLIVYTKADAKEHLTVMDRDLEIVGAFLRGKKKTQTNADRIRSMTDEELADMLDEVSVHGILALGSDFPCDVCRERTECKNCFEDWLKAESEE